MSMSITFHVPQARVEIRELWKIPIIVGRLDTEHEVHDKV